MDTSQYPDIRPSAYVTDRGPAKYFHGRKEVLGKFGELLRRSDQENSGTTFVIQGAPGAGKTALLHECEKLARDRGWEIASLLFSTSVFWNPVEAQRCLGSTGVLGITGRSLQISRDVLGKPGGSTDRSRETILKILQSGKKPLLLPLDEAQILGITHLFPADKIGTACDVLNAIHNGELGRPVIFIAAGLGTTVEAFGALGISRFAKHCLVELGVLDKEAERAVLHDWLTKDGEAKGDTTAWIDAIVQDTHGWPQHILVYVKPALDQLYADNGVMTAEGLNAVLSAGRASRTEYYCHRTGGFYGGGLGSIANSIADVPAGSRVDRAVIMSHLSQDYGHDEAERIFRQALHQGVLDERDDSFAAPIPSMHDWLVSNYARERI